MVDKVRVIDPEKIWNDIKTSSELSGSAMQFLLSRVQMIDANPILTMIVMKDLLKLNIEKAIKDDIDRWLDENPEESLDIEEAIESSVNDVVELLEKFREAGAVSIKEVEISG